jgi:hypothetical protein
LGQASAVVRHDAFGLSDDTLDDLARRRNVVDQCTGFTGNDRCNVEPRSRAAA